MADSGDKRGGMTGGESAGRLLDGKLKISFGSLPVVVGDLVIEFLWLQSIAKNKSINMLNPFVIPGRR